MSDKLTVAHRSWNMSRIPGTNTKPELAVRSILHKAGFRFTVNGPLNRKLPGKPDIVLPKYQTVVFVHGCFWHQHRGCKAARVPKSSSKGVNWEAKLAGNVKRDQINALRLKELDWRVVIIWECQVKQEPTQVVTALEDITSGMRAGPGGI